VTSLRTLAETHNKSLEPPLCFIKPMSDSWLKEWSEEKVQLAIRLSKGECGGTYAESVLILCSVLSGISADIWPERGYDRKRFVELLVKYTSSSTNVTKVSIPLLIGYYRDNGKRNISMSLRDKLLPFGDTRVLTSDDVDKNINDIINDFPDADIKTLKKHSYANLLYEEIRSGYAHEYMPGTRSDSLAMGFGRANSHVSYVNMASKLDRLIYLSISWLSLLVREVVENLTVLDEKPIFQNYSDWWLDI